MRLMLIVYKRDTLIEGYQYNCLLPGKNAGANRVCCPLPPIQILDSVVAGQYFVCKFEVLVCLGDDDIVFAIVL